VVLAWRGESRYHLVGMTSIQMACALSDVTKASSAVMVCLDPEVIDYPGGKGTTLVVCGGGKEARIPLTAENLVVAAGMLEFSLLGEDAVIVGWGLKNLFTYFLHVTKKPLAVRGQVYDLKLLERYLGVDAQAPRTLNEALRRLKAVLSDPSWPKLQEVHRRVHLPLSLHAVPAIECSPLLDTKTRRYAYGYYEIEGQRNGRMRCPEPFGEHGFNPHVVGPEMRERLIPRSRDEFFLYFDYQHMEVSMLQWLAKDEALGRFLAMPGDVYANIYQAVAGVPDRERGKKLVLPVIYGEFPSTLAQEWGIPLDEARGLIGALQHHLRASFEWIGREFPGGRAEDVLGRRRVFEEKQYKIRNFLVQSPASLVCLEKLVELERAVRGLARVVMSVHDGYVLSGPLEGWREVSSLAATTLESPSHFCPGLRLTVGFKAGKKLGELRKMRSASRG
jgi:hypothetical protein